MDDKEDIETRIDRIENQMALVIRYLHSSAEHGNRELHALGRRIPYDDIYKMDMAVFSAKRDGVSPEEFVKSYSAQFPKYIYFLDETLFALKQDHIYIDYCDKVREYLKSIKKST